MACWMGLFCCEKTFLFSRTYSIEVCIDIEKSRKGSDEKWEIQEMRKKREVFTVYTPLTALSFSNSTKFSWEKIGSFNQEGFMSRIYSPEMKTLLFINRETFSLMKQPGSLTSLKYWVGNSQWGEIDFGRTFRILIHYSKEEWSKGTLDWPPKIQTTNLFGPFWLSAGSWCP